MAAYRQISCVWTVDRHSRDRLWQLIGKVVSGLHSDAQLWLLTGTIVTSYGYFLGTKVSAPLIGTVVSSCGG